MRYLPHSDEEIKQMLETIGVSSIEDLFASIPQSHRFSGTLPLPEPMDEWSIKNLFDDMLWGSSDPYDALVGAGAYFHIVPEAVWHVVSRSEFMTAYTPYQPEVSQGTLQAMFEFQTMVSELMGLEVANASLYDGATALGEAVLMAHRLLKGKRRTVLVSRALHPLYLKTLLTYVHSVADIRVKWLEWDPETGATTVPAEVDGDVFAIAVGYPNFFGVVEDLAVFADAAQAAGAHLIASVPDPALLSVLESPGRLGATIAVGEGSGLAGTSGMGGPGLGLMATTRKAIKQLPGRLVGKTVDTEGREGYVLTLSSREQHIRRERATSNICSNQALVALAFAVHVSMLGYDGLHRMTTLGVRKLARVMGILEKIGATRKFTGPVVNEMVIHIPDSRKVLEDLRNMSVYLGIPLDRWLCEEFKDDVLVCTTEVVSDEVIDRIEHVLLG